MAILVSAATGNLTAAATWKVVDTGTFPTLRATQEFATNSIGTGTFSSPNFTVATNITVDAVLLKHNTTNAADTETITVSIYNVTAGTTVASVTRGPGSFPIATGTPNWFQFEFSGGFALTTATNYQIRITGAGGNNQVTVYRKSATASDWTFGLRTTTTAAPANGDILLICGKYAAAGGLTSYTVTNDNTNAALLLGNGVAGTAGIEVSYGSALVNGVAASTNYSLRASGDFQFNGGSSFTCGTQASPFPQSSTATFEIFQPANGRFSLIARSAANAVTSFVCYENQTNKRAQGRVLTGGIAVGATSFTVPTGTNWKSGDEIVVPTTARDYTQVEYRTMSANETAGTVQVSSAFTYSHDQYHDFPYDIGYGPQSFVDAIVCNLTKPILWKGTSSTLRAGNFDTGTTLYLFLSGVCFQNWGRIGIAQQALLDKDGADILGYAFLQDIVLKDHAGNGLITISYNPVGLEVYQYTSARPLALSTPALQITSTNQSLINWPFLFYFANIFSYGGTGTFDGRVRFLPRLSTTSGASGNTWDVFSGATTDVYDNIYINGLNSGGQGSYYALDFDGGFLPGEGGSSWTVDLWAVVTGTNFSESVKYAGHCPYDWLWGIACIKNNGGIFYDTDNNLHEFIISQENTSTLINIRNTGSPYPITLTNVKLGISTALPSTNIIQIFNSCNLSISIDDFYGGTATTFQNVNFVRFVQADESLYGVPKVNVYLTYYSSPFMGMLVDQYATTWNYWITNQGQITLTSIEWNSGTTQGPVTYIKNGVTYPDNSLYYLNAPSTVIEAGSYGNITSPSKFVVAPTGKKIRVSVWVYTTVTAGTATTYLQGVGTAPSTTTTGAWTKLTATATSAAVGPTKYELTVRSVGTNVTTRISDWNVELI